MAIGVYQSSGEGATIAKPLQFSSQRSFSETLSHVPQTVIPLQPCTIEGSPKPKTSPQYTEYKLGTYDDIYDSSQSNDIGWMAARFCNRVDSSPNVDVDEHDTGISQPPILPAFSESQPDEHQLNDDPEDISDNQFDAKQHVHLWSAYNSLVHSPSHQDNLPVIY